MLHVPDHCVRADDELGSGVPLVVGDVVVGLQPNPLLPFGEEPVVAGLPFAILHHYRIQDTHRESKLTDVHRACVCVCVCSISLSE